MTEKQIVTLIVEVRTVDGKIELHEQQEERVVYGTTYGWKYIRHLNKRHYLTYRDGVPVCRLNQLEVT